MRCNSLFTVTHIILNSAVLLLFGPPHIIRLITVYQYTTIQLLKYTYFMKQVFPTETVYGFWCPRQDFRTVSPDYLKSISKSSFSLRRFALFLLSPPLFGAPPFVPWAAASVRYLRQLFSTSLGCIGYCSLLYYLLYDTVLYYLFNHIPA